MQFPEPEAVSVRCDVHGWMSACIIVVDHPFHSITDADGNFVINNLPAGTYKLKCWQEFLGEKAVEIKVEAGATASVVFQYNQE
jgi:uncharacterized protein (DUF2141 family)